MSDTNHPHVEMVACPNCGGDGIGGIQPVCCRRPNRNGECCGDPDPEQYPCQFCRGTGQLEYYESPARPTAAAKENKS